MARRLVVGLLAAALSLPALAGPYARAVSLSAGTDDHVEPLGVPSRLQIADPAVLHAERLPTGEVLLQAKAKGATDLFLFGDTWAQVWRVRVDTPPRPGKAKALAAARKACPGLKTSDDGAVAATVSTAACVGALMALAPHLLRSELSLQWTPEGLEAQVARMQAVLTRAAPKLAAKLTLGFLGVNLHLGGTLASVAELDRALQILWGASAGPLLLDLSDLQIAGADGPEPVAEAVAGLDALPPPHPAAAPDAGPTAHP